MCLDFVLERKQSPLFQIVRSVPLKRRVVMKQHGHVGTFSYQRLPHCAGNSLLCCFSRRVCLVPFRFVSLGTRRKCPFLWFLSQRWQKHNGPRMCYDSTKINGFKSIFVWPRQEWHPGLPHGQTRCARLPEFLACCGNTVQCVGVVCHICFPVCISERHKPKCHEKQIQERAGRETLKCWRICSHWFK